MSKILPLIFRSLWVFCPHISMYQCTCPHRSIVSCAVLRQSHLLWCNLYSFMSRPMGLCQAVFPPNLSSTLQHGREVQASCSLSERKDWNIESYWFWWEIGWHHQKHQIETINTFHLEEECDWDPKIHRLRDCPEEETGKTEQLWGYWKMSTAVDLKQSRGKLNSADNIQDISCESWEVSLEILTLFDVIYFISSVPHFRSLRNL